VARKFLRDRCLVSSGATAARLDQGGNDKPPQTARAVASRRQRRTAGRPTLRKENRLRIPSLRTFVRRRPVQTSVARWACPVHAARVGRSLFGDIGDNDWASARLLTCCRGGEVVDQIVWAWRRRVAARRIDETTNELRRFLLRADVREEAAERMRAMLADDDALVRLEATAFLGRIGTLDDIGLLSDLLALPPMTDEDPRERKGLLLAMRRISQS